MAGDCLFCKMASGAIAVPKVVEDAQAFAIRDIHPRAPTHILVIPREHIDDARDLGAEHGDLLGALFGLAVEAGKLAGVHEKGYRLAFNVGEAAGMTISHLHLHLLGGRPLGPEG
ncbi:MAG: HIT domain-containing protein [Dehalococcoidia bacterium]